MGKDTTTYSISFVNKNMKEDGSFENIEKPDSGQMFAEPFLRIFPRQITLAPGEPQVIMLQCRRMPNMLPGEYRSHLFFRSERDYYPLGEKKIRKDTNLVSVQLIPIYGMSIPIIIRNGKMEVNTNLTDLKLIDQNDSLQNLKLTINRKGNYSSYGNLIVEYLPLKGYPLTIGSMNGVSVYTNINKRNVTIKLNKIPGVVFTNGNLRVRYTSRVDVEKYQVYAEALLPLKEQPSMAQGASGEQGKDKNIERKKEQ
jgi:hypothetical protein